MLDIGMRAQLRLARERIALGILPPESGKSKKPRSLIALPSKRSGS
jgi:hypothetical protein